MTKPSLRNPGINGPQMAVSSQPRGSQPDKAHPDEAHGLNEAVALSDSAPLLRSGVEALGRIAQSLERLAPPPPVAGDLQDDEGFLWQAHPGYLRAVAHINHIPLTLLCGVEEQKARLLANTRAFALGYPANNALLWGAKGSGKSSLVKSVFCAINRKLARKRRLALIEIPPEDMASLPALLAVLHPLNRRCIVFCDDLSFSKTDRHYRSLKSILEGGIENHPDHILFYATSNLRHLTLRENKAEQSPLTPADAMDESVSLSDRFGLWLGFHALDQETYLDIVMSYAATYGLSIPLDQLRAECLEWARMRGALSGRVAWQYIRDLAGRLKKPLREETEG